MEQFELSAQTIKKLRDPSTLKGELESGKKIQEILGFSPEAMSSMYRSAHHFFTERKYEDSSKAFLFLSTLDPGNFDYWMGLGMSVQLCGDYEGGIDAYEMAAFLDVENPVSYFYLSKCFFAMHDRENAKQALEMAIEYSSGNPEYSELRQHALAALQLIQHEL